MSCVKGRPRVFIFEQKEDRGFTTRRLRVETEDNVCNADKSAGIDLEKMVEERDTYRSARGVGNSPSLGVVYLASFAALTNAEFVLSGSVTDDDGALHGIAFRHARFSS